MKYKSEEAAERAKLEARLEAAEQAAAESIADSRNNEWYHKCLNLYKRDMQDAFDEIPLNDYIEESKLKILHEGAKEKALNLVWIYYISIERPKNEIE